MARINSPQIIKKNRSSKFHCALFALSLSTRLLKIKKNESNRLRPISSNQMFNSIHDGITQQLAGRFWNLYLLQNGQRDNLIHLRLRQTYKLFVDQSFTQPTFQRGSISRSVGRCSDWSRIPFLFPQPWMIFVQKLPFVCQCCVFCINIKREDEDLQEIDSGPVTRENDPTSNQK